MSAVDLSLSNFLDSEGIVQLLLVRHGQTVSNTTGLIQGQSDSPLTQTGQAQIKALAQRLSRSGCRLNYTILTSPLGRAEASAAILRDQLGGVVRTDERFAELSFGAAEGSTWAAVAQRFPEIIEAWHQHHEAAAFPQGETRQAAVDRVMAGLDSLPWIAPRHRYIIVTHGGVLAALFAHILSIPCGVRPACIIPNAGLSHISKKAQSYRIVSWSDTAHLEANSFGAV